MLSIAIYTSKSLQYFPSLDILYPRLPQLKYRFLIADTVPLAHHCSFSSLEPVYSQGLSLGGPPLLEVGRSQSHK